MIAVADVDYPWEDFGPEPHQSHVLLYYGFDQTAAGYDNPPLKRCPFCTSLETLVFYEDRAGFGRSGTAHQVICGGCGATGPIAHTESQAAARWNARSRP